MTTTHSLECLQYKGQTIPSVDKDVEKVELLCIAGENVK